MTLPAAVRAAVRPRPRPGRRRVDAAPSAAGLARRSCRRRSGSATTATGSPSTTTCPASPAPLRRCSSPTWRRSPSGSGSARAGVMLPNHAPLVIAEQFGMLEALHPGRIDLGIGRAPGTDPRTAAALPSHAEPAGAGPPGAARRALRLLQRHVPRRPPVPRHHRGARPAATSRRSGCSARATTAPASPGCSACRSPSPTTSPPPTRCRPSTCTGAASGRRRCSPSPT